MLKQIAKGLYHTEEEVVQLTSNTDTASKSNTQIAAVFSKDSGISLQENGVMLSLY